MGRSFLLEMKENPETVKIVITGFSSEQVGIKAADYGAGNDFLVKPVRAEELLAVVRQRLEANTDQKLKRHGVCTVLLTADSARKKYSSLHRLRNGVSVLFRPY